MRCTLGVDIGTSSSKGVLADPSGTILATAAVDHRVDRPHVGWVEMDARLWWREFCDIAHQLRSEVPRAGVTAVGVSGMGPCVLLADDGGNPVRPAILYGIDTRATPQIARMETELGAEAITRVGGSSLSSQAAGPKIAWIADEEPAAYARARLLLMPASYLVRCLTATYVLDHQSASQTSPLYDVNRNVWHHAWWERFAPGIRRPALRWAGEVAGVITSDAAARTGLPAGTPVITGTIDAWAEAVSVGAHAPGDLLLMYGTTLFLIATTEEPLRSPSMWTTAGAFPGTYSLAGGLATSGALTAWLRELTGADYPALLAEAARSGPGAHGLAMLPFFAGERTPIQDPDARGVIAGLTLNHTRGDLYRATLEATAMGVRHNVQAMRDAGADIRRIIAAGGGTQGRLWQQIVSDATGLTQLIPRTTIGAAYGGAFLAAVAASSDGQAPRITDWNPANATIRPDPETAAAYDGMFARYRRLYSATADVAHELAAIQQAEP